MGVDHLIERGRSNDMTWGLPEDDIINQYLAATEEDRFKEFSREAERHPGKMNYTIGERIVEDEHSYVDWTSRNQLWMKDEHKRTGRCDFYLAESGFYTEALGIAFPKGSQWVERFNYIIDLSIEAHFADRWRSLHWPLDDDCSVLRIGGITTTVNVVDMSGSFFILGVGSLISAFFLCGELCLFKRKTEREKSVIKPFVA